MAYGHIRVSGCCRLRHTYSRFALHFQRLLKIFSSVARIIVRVKGRVLASLGRPNEENCPQHNGICGDSGVYDSGDRNDDLYTVVSLSFTPTRSSGKVDQTSAEFGTCRLTLVVTLSRVRHLHYFHT